MGFFDKLISGGSQKPAPPPYSATNNNNNSSSKPAAINNPSKLNPYPPTVTSPTTPISPNTNQAGSSGTSDNRPLPPGWVKEWHEGYKRFYYVDTLAPGGPVSHWIHPSDNPQAQDRTGFGPTNLNPQPPQAYGYGQPQQPVFQQQPFYQQQQPLPQMMGNNNRRGRAGMNPLMAGAGGLAGGMLLGSMLGGHHGYDDGYYQGYENGYDNGFDNGDMFGGGGDFGGGDFF